MHALHERPLLFNKMDNNERLRKLKALRVSENEKKARFSTLDKLSEWSDNVAPLLKYDKNHYETFAQAINTAKMPLSGKSISYYLSVAISTANQAVIELENKIVPNETPNPSSDSSDSEHNISEISASKMLNWHEKPLGKIAIGVIIVILATITLWIINHYFPFMNF